MLPGPAANGPTLGWEARREGIDDYRYLQALREAIGQATGDPDPRRRALGHEAQKYLQEVERVTVRPPQPYPATQTGRVYDHGVHPGLSPAQYDAIRARVADWRCRLQGI